MKNFLAVFFLAAFVGSFASLVLFAPNPAHADTVLSSSRLQWQWPYPTNNIVFNIHAQTNFAIPFAAWPTIGTTTQTSLVIDESAPVKFFFVLASNTVTGAVSPWP